MRKRKLIAISLALSIILGGCTVKSEVISQKEAVPSNGKFVNLYTDRHYESDEKLYEEFTKDTGIKVNVVKGNSDELIERLEREGKDTQADLFVTADAGRLHRAKEKGLLQAVTSETLSKNIPVNLRDKDNNWYGLTMRARVLVYDKNKMRPEQLSTYEDLADPKWKGKVLVRSSSAIYNQSLVASFIALQGEEAARSWAKGIVDNMARAPKGNDRDQAKAVVAGEGDIAIMNTYYIGLMSKSSDPEEVKIAQKVGVFFPNQGTTGTHVNVSGIGMTKNVKNKENAIQFMEFLSSEKAQKQFAEANFEYPANPEVEAAELLKSWGDFKPQNVDLSKLGEYNKKAQEIMNEVGWK